MKFQVIVDTQKHDEIFS